MVTDNLLDNLMARSKSRFASTLKLKLEVNFIKGYEVPYGDVGPVLFKFDELVEVCEFFNEQPCPVTLSETGSLVSENIYSNANKIQALGVMDGYSFISALTAQWVNSDGRSGDEEEIGPSVIWIGFHKKAINFRSWSITTIPANFFEIGSYGQPPSDAVTMTKTPKRKDG